VSNEVLSAGVLVLTSGAVLAPPRPRELLAGAAASTLVFLLVRVIARAAARGDRRAVRQVLTVRTMVGGRTSSCRNVLRIRSPHDVDRVVVSLTWSGDLAPADAVRTAVVDDARRCAAPAVDGPGRVAVSVSSRGDER
jgi:hypothetical protein